MFDVDGTLVDSAAVEDICFPRACEDALGLESVSTDWRSYRIPSDSGVVAELVERNFGRAATAGDLERVEQRFLSLLQTTYGQSPELFREVAGARVAFERARQLPDTVVSIATAGLLTTAKLKLTAVGFEISDIEITTSNDAPAKVDVMRIAHERARARAGTGRFASVTYLGDSAWDRRSAAELGFDFLGIDTSGSVRDHDPCFPHFGDWNAISERILKNRRIAASRS
jgi:phosphoglycolate phosphatase-like HAD superfamily hydrolase